MSEQRTNSHDKNIHDTQTKTEYSTNSKHKWVKHGAREIYRKTRQALKIRFPEHEGNLKAITKNLNKDNSLNISDSHLCKKPYIKDTKKDDYFSTYIDLENQETGPIDKEKDLLNDNMQNLEHEEEVDLPLVNESLMISGGLSTSSLGIRNCKIFKSAHSIWRHYINCNNVIGTGINGHVYKAQDRITNQFVAIKEFDKSSLSASKLKQLFNEVHLFVQLDHPNISKLKTIYENDKYLYLCMEYCSGGELFDRLQQKGHYSELDAALAMKEMLLAINYLHARNICHRDIKLENWVYDTPQKDAKLKLIDFGFSMYCASGSILTARHGTRYYLSPELLQGKHDQKSDMWSLGVLGYMLFSGYPPFTGATDKDIHKQILNYNISFDHPIWDKVSPSALDFIQSLLMPDPYYRLSAAEALKHPWLTPLNNTEIVNFNSIPLEVLEKMRQFSAQSVVKRAAIGLIAQCVSLEGLIAIEDAFKSIDSSCTGTLKLAEITQSLEKEFDMSPEEARDIFNKIDQTGDDELHYSEFLAVSLQTKLLMDDSYIYCAFRRFDLDDRGYISAEDIVRTLGDMFTGETVQSFMSQCDTNLDGLIDYNGFRAAVLCDSSATTDEKNPIITKFSNFLAEQSSTSLVKQFFSRAYSEKHELNHYDYMDNLGKSQDHKNDLIVPKLKSLSLASTLNRNDTMSECDNHFYNSHRKIKDIPHRPVYDSTEVEKTKIRKSNNLKNDETKINQQNSLQKINLQDYKNNYQEKTKEQKGQTYNLKPKTTSLEIKLRSEEPQTKGIRNLTNFINVGDPGLQKHKKDTLNTSTERYNMLRSYISKVDKVPLQKSKPTIRSQSFVLKREIPDDIKKYGIIILQEGKNKCYFSNQTINKKKNKQIQREPSLDTSTCSASEVHCTTDEPQNYFFKENGRLTRLKTRNSIYKQTLSNCSESSTNDPDYVICEDTQCSLPEELRENDSCDTGNVSSSLKCCLKDSSIDESNHSISDFSNVSSVDGNRCSLINKFSESPSITIEVCEDNQPSFIKRESFITIMNPDLSQRDTSKNQETDQ